jgi:uncharacterized protein YgiM (DUF1202 family)
MGQWTSKAPEKDGWYWITYGGKNGKVKCPASIFYVGKRYLVRTARNDSFTDQTRKVFGFANAKFGPRISVPK